MRQLTLNDTDGGTGNRIYSAGILGGAAGWICNNLVGENGDLGGDDSVGVTGATAIGNTQHNWSS